MCHHHHRAFTLIELVVVLVVAAVLSATAIAVFSTTIGRTDRQSAPEVITAADTGARQLASENQAGYQFPVIGSDCVTGQAGLVSVPAAGLSVTASTSSGPAVVSACVATGTDTLYLAVVDQAGGCELGSDTLVATALPAGVSSSTTSTTTGGTDGLVYGRSTTTAPCSAGSLYGWVSAGHQLTSTDPSSPTPAAL